MEGSTSERDGSSGATVSVVTFMQSLVRSNLAQNWSK
jgi:hypothetical protein